VIRSSRFTLCVAFLLPLALPVGGCDVVSGVSARIRGSQDGGAASAAEDPSSQSNVYYQYVDDSGSVRFVQHKGEIPSKYRATAGKIEVEKRRPSAPATPPKARSEIWQKAAEAPWETRAQQVVMYTAPWCGVCRRAEAFFQREGVRFTAKDIEADDRYKRELIQKTGRSAVPVIEIGEQRMIGFDRRRIERILSL